MKVCTMLSSVTSIVSPRSLGRVLQGCLQDGTRNESQWFQGKGVLTNVEGGECVHACVC